MADEVTPPKSRRVQVWNVLLAAFLGVALGMGLTIFAVIKSSRDSRSATCSVVAANRAEKRQQLEQYQENPPTTELARSLQHTYQDSLAAWEGLWSTLGCKDTAAAGR